MNIKTMTATSIAVLAVLGFADAWPRFSQDAYAMAQHEDHAGHHHEATDSGKAPAPPRDPNRLWCGEHGVYEDECFICHPELEGQEAGATGHHDGHDPAEAGSGKAPSKPRDPKRLWCGEHGVYEDECFICHPELESRGAGATGDRGLWCNEHRVAEIECGICQPQIAGTLEPGGSLKIRLPSPASAEKAGIRTGRPRLADTSASVEVFCEVGYNQNRLARVTPLARGVIHEVDADVGDYVERGQRLVVIASSEVADAKRDLHVAIVKQRVQQLAYEREKGLVEKEISAAQIFQQVEAEFQMAELIVSSARQRLINLGFTAREVSDVEKTKSSSSFVHVHAPFSGTLVERTAVVGEAATPGAPLFTLADLDFMWLNLLIPESRLSGVAAGLPVKATFATLPGFEATGQIDWVSTSVTEPSRMVEARAVVSNGERKLRANLFGEARIVLSGDARALTVPTASVQRLERNPFVFVKIEEDLYGLRRVHTGIDHGGRIQIVKGLEPGDSVVVSGSFIMMSEFLKSRLGAGCVHD